MQPFSSRNFQPAVPGYDKYWYETSLQLEHQNPTNTVFSWPQEALAATSDFENGHRPENTDRLFRSSNSLLLQLRLGIRIPAQQASADEEDFTLQGYRSGNWQSVSLTTIWQAGKTMLQQFSAEGLLPHGRAAASEWLKLQTEYQPLLDQLSHFHDLPPLGRNVECSFDNGLLLSGEVDACYP